jgi:hypothetical protein
MQINNHWKLLIAIFLFLNERTSNYSFIHLFIHLISSTNKTIDAQTKATLPEGLVNPCALSYGIFAFFAGKIESLDGSILV